jgi:hypothetical protein
MAVASGLKALLGLAPETCRPYARSKSRDGRSCPGVTRGQNAFSESPLDEPFVTDARGSKLDRVSQLRQNLTNIARPLLRVQVRLAQSMPRFRREFLLAVALWGGPFLLQAVAQTHQNLQVLPSDMAQPQLMQVMAGFTQALGVQCGFCHVPTPPASGFPGPPPGSQGGGRGGPPPFDFPSDDKPQKRAARAMMLMVRDLNPKVATAVGKSPEATTQVRCVTCHRGVPIPRPISDILDVTSKTGGTLAAIAEYRDLRKRYFGAQAYDFGEATLVTYAQRASQADKPDDALLWLRLNLEYYPLSARTYAGMSEAQQRKGDKPEAVKSLEKAIELDPQNGQLKTRLERLKAE